MSQKEVVNQSRILVLSYEYLPLGGGGAKVVGGLVNEFASKGYTIDVVTMRFRGLKKVEKRDNITIYRVPSVRIHESRCFAIEMVPYIFFAFLKCLSLTKKHKYMLNHTHFIFPDGLVSFLIKIIRKLPLVVTAHGSDVPGYNPNRFKLLHVLLLPFWKMIVRNIDCIACPSMIIQDLINKNVPFATTRVVPNAIDIDKFCGDKPKDKKILIVTRMFKRKGVQYVLEALQGLEHDFEVNIVGDGPYLGALQKQATDLGNNVIFHGYMENTSEEFIDLYETSRIFVFPSEVENFPIVLLEAMGAGMAIITTKGTGCAEVVGDTGLLVEPRNVEEIRKNLAHLINNESYCKEIGQLARERFVENFSWSAVTKQYTDLYKTVSE
ncbi:glycosyltransferase family 4 protein [Candidatus Omnitrophota bacterium]